MISKEEKKRRKELKRARDEADFQEFAKSKYFDSFVIALFLLILLVIVLIIIGIIYGIDSILSWNRIKTAFTYFLRYPIII